MVQILVANCTIGVMLLVRRVRAVLDILRRLSIHRPATDTRSHCTEPYCCTAVSGQSHKSHTLSRQTARGHHLGHQTRLGGTSSQVYSTLRSYKHYKVRNQPPPPTPCSTDNFEESDSQVAYHSSPSPSSIPKMAQDLRVLAGGNNRHTDTNDWGRTTIVILTHHHPLQQDRITCQMLHVHRHLRQNDHILIRYPLHLPHHLSRFRFSMFYFFFFQENELGIKICSLFERNCTAILIV